LLAYPAYRSVLAASTKGVAGHVLNQLRIAGECYLADHDNEYWPYRKKVDGGVEWWFGFESAQSLSRKEGERVLDTSRGGLGPYVYNAGGNMKVDPSFVRYGNRLKPKYTQGAFAFGYNTHLVGKNPLILSDPGRVVVFATCAQVNTFQRPASPAKPMVEEFYMLNSKEVTIHFRVNGQAMVIFADGSGGFLPMDESTRDKRIPEADIGRFAPPGSTLYLE